MLSRLLLVIWMIPGLLVSLEAASPSAGAIESVIPSVKVDPAVSVETCTLPASIESDDQAKVKAFIGHLKARVAYPAIPSVYAKHLPSAEPQHVELSPDASPGLSDPMIEEARRIRAFADFKPLSDARKKTLTNGETSAVLAEATQAGESAVGELRARSGSEAVSASELKAEARSCRKAFLHTYIEGAYAFGNELRPLDGIVAPRWKLKPRDAADGPLAGAFDYTEKTLVKLIRRTPRRSEGSLLPNPYPFAIPAGRFQEAYYWDSYFGMMGLLATGRLTLSQMQVENFLEAVRTFGFIPNGMRDYYLSRSQPPFLTSMVRDVYEASLARAASAKDPSAEKARIHAWLKDRAFPLMRKDYEDFWMNPRTRYDSVTGLNHHWDEFNLPRPERHAADDELKLGRTYRDVRAEAESGMDFTVAFGGDASRVADVLLNSMLFKTEEDLAWAARELGEKRDAARFEAAARRRQHAIDRYLWDPAKGIYENYDLRTRKRIPVLSAAVFAPLFVRAASDRQAGNVRSRALPALERSGGLMASDALSSTDQWDGLNGWAPFQVMAVQGLRNYSYDADARRLADKWVRLIAKVESGFGAMYERMDVAHGAQALADGTKYPPQRGFLWTNSSFVWMVKDILGYPLEPLR